MVVEVTGLLDPVMAELIENSVADVADAGATLLVFRVDSNRSVVSDQRLGELAEAIAASPVPIAIWVGPNGSSLEGKVAQLFAVADEVGIAPGTSVGNLGASLPMLADYPVAWTNQELITDHKLGWRELISEGVIACEPRTIDDLRDRYNEAGIPFDPETVRVPPEVEQCVAPLIGDFLVDLDHLGFASNLINVDGQPRLEPITQVQFRGLSLAHQLFHTVASPPVAYLLLTIGMGLMLFEFFTAGIGVAGVLGAVLFILAGYGLSVPAPQHLGAGAFGCVDGGVRHRHPNVGAPLLDRCRNGHVRRGDMVALRRRVHVVDSHGGDDRVGGGGHVLGDAVDGAHPLLYAHHWPRLDDRRIG